MRLILDTNILVSAFAFRSQNAKIVLELAAREHILLFSEATFIELTETLFKPKFTEAIEINVIKGFLNNLKKIGIFIIPSITITACRDPKDDIFLELAITGKADRIISGDKDLLVLNPFRGIPIISAKEFLDNV